MSENAPPYEYSLVRGFFYLVDKKRILTISNFSQNRNSLIVKQISQPKRLTYFYVDYHTDLSNFNASYARLLRGVRFFEKMGYRFTLADDV